MKRQRHDCRPPSCLARTVCLPCWIDRWTFFFRRSRDEYRPHVLISLLLPFLLGPRVVQTATRPRATQLLHLHTRYTTPSLAPGCSLFVFSFEYHVGPRLIKWNPVFARITFKHHVTIVSDNNKVSLARILFYRLSMIFNLFAQCWRRIKIKELHSNSNMWREDQRLFFDVWNQGKIDAWNEPKNTSYSQGDTFRLYGNLLRSFWSIFDSRKNVATLNSTSPVIPAESSNCSSFAPAR